MTGTVTLTSNGTVALTLTTVGTLSEGSAFNGQFLPGALDPIFLLTATPIVDTTFGTSSAQTIIGVNTFTYVNLDAGFTPQGEILSPLFTGEQGTLTYKPVAYIDEEVFALAKGTSPAQWQVAAGSGGTLTSQGLEPALTTTLQFAPSTMYPFNHGGHIGLVVDPQGIVFDTTTNEYVAATFFPQLNAAAPAGTSGFAGGYADTVNGHNYFVVNKYDTVTPFSQQPSLVEETNQGASDTVYQYAFNDTVNVPGDVYNIAGNTPNGFFFCPGNETGIIEVNPATASYTLFTFAAQDSSAAACLNTVLTNSNEFIASRDSVGTWWLTNSFGSSGCSPQNSFVFAKSSTGTTAVTMSLALNSISGGNGEVLVLQGGYNYANTSAPTNLDIGFIQPNGEINWVDSAADTIGTSTPSGAFTVNGAILP